MRFLLILFLLLFTGCAHKQTNLVFREMTDSDCHFSRKNLTLDPEDVVKNYVKNDGEGKFTLTSAWFDSATLCPGHEEGPELSYVIRSSKIVKLDIGKGDGRASAQVEYEVLGLIEPAAEQRWRFVRKQKKKHRIFKLVHTAYGWRIRDSHLVDGEFLSIATAVSRVSSKQDKHALAELGNITRKGESPF